VGFWDKVKEFFGGKPASPASSDASPPVAGSDQPSPPAATATAKGTGATTTAIAVHAAPTTPSKDRYRADEILGLSAAELRKRALKIDPMRTAWIGRVDTIPPQSDERTALIDRGLILRGLLNPSQIEEIHRIGDQWIRHHDTVRLAETLAHETVEKALEAERQENAARKLKKRQEAAERKAQRAAAIARRKVEDIIYLGRGVSARLNDRRSHVEALKKENLPLLSSPQDVARALGLMIPELRWLCFHAEATERTHYVYFEVPKRSGGTRLLSAPHARLGAAQRWIFANVLSGLDVTRHAHGFVRGRSTVSNAVAHLGKALVVNLDLTDFFPSITFPRVRGLFESIGYSPAAATTLALLCTESPRTDVVVDGKRYWVAVGERALPQGACTSPSISNLVARKLDRRLAGTASKLGWSYTRYADDLTFSAGPEQKKTMALLLARIRHVVREEGFAINEKKGRVQHAARRQEVTGIVVNDRPSLAREELRRLRAIVHGATKTGLEAQNRENRPNFEAWLRGKIAYVMMIDRAKGSALREKLDEIGRVSR
jgi:retron-type reverse transcriptase